VSETRPLRVLHVVQGYTPAVGGTERVVQRLSEELVSRWGDEVTVFTTDCLSAEAFARPDQPRLAPGEEMIGGVHVRRFAVRRRLGSMLRRPQDITFRLGLPGNDYLRHWYAGPIVPGLERAIRRQPADVIAASSFPLRHMFMARRAAHRTGRPCVLIGGIHPEDRWGYDRASIYREAARAEVYVAYTDFEARHVIERGAERARVEVIGPGIDPDDFPEMDSTAAKAALGLGDGPVVGFVGQLGAHKGLNVLLDAMSTVWATLPNVRLLVAGRRTASSVPIQGRLDEARRLSEGRVVVRWDFAEEEKAGLFAAIDVLVSPSSYESFGLTFLEAWAAGKPVIACRAGAIREVVSDGVDGCLVPVGDEAALAAAMVDLIRNQEARCSMGERGRRRVRAHHSWEAVTARFRETYLRARSGKDAR
jgi:glycosyltransferase involved in cell wall biosynthesis